LKDSHRSHLGKRVTTSTGKIHELNFFSRKGGGGEKMFERMKAVAKRSNPFVRGFTKPPPHIVQTLSFPQHLGEALPPNS